MNVIDVGSGPPLVLVPGIQGRWEWMRPGVEALARYYRVITFSLCDEPTSGHRVDRGAGFSCYVRQVREAMDAARVETAIICGMSYGGLIAASFAAEYPERTRAVVLISALCPGWRANARARFYLRAPRLLFPLFILSSLRLVREIAAASDGVWTGMAAAVRHGLNVLQHPMSPSRMARRVRLVDRLDPAPALRQLRVPTLVITGEDRLDLVVPPSHSREYLALWPHAVCDVLGRTGHLGLITRPKDLVRSIETFARGLDGGSDRSRAASAGGSDKTGPARDTVPLAVERKRRG